MQLIIGGAQVSYTKLRAFLDIKCKYISVTDREEIAAAYTTFGKLTGIGNVYPLAQWGHETGYGTSERWIKSHNPAGLGATNDGAWGGHFDTIAHGVLAQYAHLLAYATTDEQLSLPLRHIVQCDPRLAALVSKFGRGIAPHWEELNGKWAVPGPTYGQKIISIGNIILKG